MNRTIYTKDTALWTWATEQAVRERISLSQLLERALRLYRAQAGGTRATVAYSQTAMTADEIARELQAIADAVLNMEPSK